MSDIGNSQESRDTWESSQMSLMLLIYKRFTSIHLLDLKWNQRISLLKLLYIHIQVVLFILNKCEKVVNLNIESSDLLMSPMYRLHTGWTWNSWSPVIQDSRAHISEISQDIASNELAISYSQSVSIKHDQNTSPWTSLTAMFQLCNQWDLISSPSLSTSNDFSQLLSMTYSPSVIFSLMSPFSEMDYWIW
jgi:hypothetical protein